MTALPPARHRMSLVLAAASALMLVSAPAMAQDAAAPVTPAPAVAAPSATIAPAPVEVPAAAPATTQVAPTAVAPPPAVAPAAPAQTPASGVEAQAPVAPPATSDTAPALAPATNPAPAAIPGTDIGSSFAPLAPSPGEDSAEAPAHDLSAWGMFMAADLVVKSVMVGLVVASVLTWTIALVKVVEILFAKRRARNGVKRLSEAANLPRTAGLRDSGWRRGPVAALVAAASAERERSDGLPADGVKERAIAELSRIEARAGRRMSRGTGLLATIGSISPFVGLFGTVWGIMNSFIGIAQANTTNLSVVAPGIAEALLATAIGLVAAIPAVIFYNAFGRSIAGYRSVLSDASSKVLQHLSRDLDRARAIPMARASQLKAAE